MGLVVKTVSYQRVVMVDLTDVPISEWCLNLCLLKEELVDTLVFLVGKQKLKFEIANIEGSAGAHVFLHSNEVHVKVHPAELECWVNFFLQYYRDGVAEVDHIDVEALTIGKEPEDTYIIFTVKDALPGMSSEEARKMLDKYD